MDLKCFTCCAEDGDALDVTVQPVLDGGVSEFVPQQMEHSVADAGAVKAGLGGSVQRSAEPVIPKLENVTVCILGARGLRSAQWMVGKPPSDCYCTIEVNDTEVASTDPVPNIVEPLWKVERQLQCMLQDTLVLKVWDLEAGQKTLLGVATLEAKQWSAAGFHGEVELRDAGDGIEAFLALKIKLPGVPYPPGPIMELLVEIEKKGKSLGLKLDSSDTTVAQVVTITNGLIADYNEAVKEDPSVQVKSGDFVCAVNGVTGAGKIVEELKKATELKILLKRPVEFAVPLGKVNGSLLGLETAMVPEARSLSIIKIHPGLVQDWNQKNPNRTIKEFDHISAVAGQRGPGPTLLSLLKKEQLLHITVCRPSPSATSYWWDAQTWA